MVQTDEWREGSVEERLEYALIKVTYSQSLLTESYLPLRPTVYVQVG